MTTNVPELFGSLVFNDKVMKKKLSAEVYSAYRRAAQTGEQLDISVAGAIADAMKDWAIGYGATHFSHWFQPMTGVTAEKHDSFIAPDGLDSVMMKFSGKELVQGEPDASSFPSGGLRSTFEARGYTAWDTSAYAFIKDGTLCIPTAFLSYSGQVLDKKTPLLRSQTALSKQVIRFLKLFGKNVDSVTVTVGCEQEYFLIDKNLFEKRKDLQACGRTLLGARPVKGQELEDHYFGTIKPRVLSYMQDLDAELWRLGILAKTRHNEAAPAQHELAPVFTSVNVATDHNQLTMEIMKKVAARHNLVCLLHEKPFAGVNGSGKHNNWSVQTCGGENLLEPGKKPENNSQFLLFMAAVLKAVDEHQDLLRLSAASAGNDHRLGSGEAPPAILSVYLGSELTDIFDALVSGVAFERKKAGKVCTGTAEISEFLLDTADRNRTSPFAFTGNKFEFRMLGASVNVACPNTIINTIVADALDFVCGRLEKDGSDENSIKKLTAEIFKKHKRIVFNGNNYSDDWQKEAVLRGLLNIKTAPEALSNYNRKENVGLFARHGVYTGEELTARREILLQNYCNVIGIEAMTLLSMALKEVLPAAFQYANELCDTTAKKKAAGIAANAETEILKEVSVLSDAAYVSAKELEKSLAAVRSVADTEAKAKKFRKLVFCAMNELRSYCDQLETLVAKKLWPFPTYSELLFSV